MTASVNAALNDQTSGEAVARRPGSAIFPYRCADGQMFEETSRVQHVTRGVDEMLVV